MAEFRPGRFEVLPLVIKNLLIINGLVYLAQITFGQQNPGWLEAMFALHDVHSELFRPHQLVTHMFMHGDFWHLFFNMFVLWMFGSTLENLWGPKRFLVFYMICGLGAAGLHLATLYYQNAELYQTYLMAERLEPEQAWMIKQYFDIPTLGASGAIYGCLAAFAYLFPNSWIYLYMLVPIKAKYLVGGLILLQLFAGLGSGAGGSGIAYWAHLGGALMGFLIVFYWNKTNRKRFY